MILVALLFVIIGILVKNGKMYFLIAGYNTMSTEEKAKYDIEGIASVMRNAMFGMAIIIAIGYFLSVSLSKPNVESFSLISALIIGLPYILIKSNSDKYKIDN